MKNKLGPPRCSNIISNLGALPPLEKRNYSAPSFDIKYFFRDVLLALVLPGEAKWRKNIASEEGEEV